MRAVVLVEGVSDQLALEVVARRRGRDLAAEGIHVEAMGGATNIGHYLDRYVPLDITVAGLYDSAEERFFRRALDRFGLADADLEDSGFFRCTADLEDELIRAVGPSQVESLVEAEGRLASFRKLQRQPAQRGRSLHDQLRRLMGGRSGGKYHYARLMAEAVDLDRIPRPLTALLDHL
ncbi:TOPRIM nucleotidyl transferase/hydrolase domain-containing protein [Kutzneria sp. NPDC051319]|uniref:TOPRIM nucleotidyl transferase/hydrolase domain-containing protein n=1 Tax=Kutzneria sp. NPDC051319 TaxID=3155047 RepID=UPI00341B3FE4